MTHRFSDTNLFILRFVLLLFYKQRINNKRLSGHMYKKIIIIMQSIVRGYYNKLYKLNTIYTLYNINILYTENVTM